MIEFTGKNTHATIMLDEVEQDVISQLYEMMTSPMFNGQDIRIMPDTHVGDKCLIGLTSKYNGYIHPSSIGVDIGCFTGDTRIPSLDGQIYTLKEMVDKGGIHYVYSLDENNMIVPGEAIALQTRKNAQLIEVIVSGGEKIICTPDHLFMLSNGKYKESKNLKPFDSLMPLYRFYQTKDGYESVRSLQSSGGLTHKIVYEYYNGKLQKNICVHHKDGKWYNNVPQNLQGMTPSEHANHHRLQKCNFRESDFQYKKMKTISNRGFFYTPKGKIKKIIVAKKNILNYMKNNSDHYKESIKNNGKRGAQFLSEWNKKNNSTLYSCPNCGREIYGKGGLSKHVKYCTKSFEKNHHVLSTKKLNYTSDVYCLHVKKFHNFALAAGIFVHNCGMTAIQFDGDTLNFDCLDKNIRKYVPLGFNIHKDKTYTMDLIGQYSQMQLKDFTKRQRVDLGIDYDPIDYSGNYLEKLCKKIDTNQEQLMSALGTLGSGNHFIEVDKDENDKKWLIIHSGSRNFGLKVANYHAKLAGKTITSCLSGDAAFEYIVDMLYAQAYASYNRVEIMKEIISPLEGTVKLDNIIESIHNFIHPQDLIIRKGAISSYTGQSMVIPFNMRDGTIICEGKSNPEWNYSAPHGAGRSMSRSQAKKTLSLEKFQKEMEGIYSTCVNVTTLDESPDSYKDKNIILENISPTATIKHVLKPIFNIKG